MRKETQADKQPEIQPNHLEVLIFASKVTIYSHSADTDLVSLVELLPLFGLCLKREFESPCG
jgi:hypothetical protein